MSDRDAFWLLVSAAAGLGVVLALSIATGIRPGPTGIAAGILLAAGVAFVVLWVLNIVRRKYD